MHERDRRRSRPRGPRSPASSAARDESVSERAAPVDARAGAGYDLVGCPPTGRRAARRPRGPRRALLPPDLPAPRDRARGAPRPVRDDQGRRLGRAARCAGRSRSSSVDPSAETFTLFVKAIGHGLAGPVRACARATSPSASGPLGRPFTPPAAGDEALLVAGGYGIAPFRFLGRGAAAPGGTARLFYGGRTGGRPAAPRALRASWGSTLVPATEDGSLGERGPRHRAARGAPRRGAGPGAALRLRPRRDAARGRPHRRGARRSRPRSASTPGWAAASAPASAASSASRARTSRAEVPLRLHRGPGLRRRPRGLAGRGRTRARARGGAARSAGVNLAVELAGIRLKNPLHRRLGHLRLRRRVRGPPRPRRCSAASSRRASTSSRATAPPPRASSRRPSGPAERDRPPGRRRPRLRAGRAAAPARRYDTAVLVNVCGDTVEEYAEVSRILRRGARASPASRSTSPAPTSRRAAWPSAATRA